MAIGNIFIDGYGLSEYRVINESCCPNYPIGKYHVLRDSESNSILWVTEYQSGGTDRVEIPIAGTNEKVTYSKIFGGNVIIHAANTESKNMVLEFRLGTPDLMRDFVGLLDSLSAYNNFSYSVGLR